MRLQVAWCGQLSSLPAGMFCGRCRYPLVGLLVHRCPECGCPFDPADPRSFSQPGTRRKRRVVPQLLAGAVVGAMIGGACITKLTHSLDGLTVALCFLSSPILAVGVACCADTVAVWILMVSGCALLYALYALGLSAAKWRYRLAWLVGIVALHSLGLFAFVWMMILILADLFQW